jgi:hypothetical protein
MRRRYGLAFELRAGESQRFDLSYALGIDFRLALRAPSPFRFPLFDLFLDPRVGVYQAFSGITHRCVLIRGLRVELWLGLSFQLCIIPMRSAIGGAFIYPMRSCG